MGKKWIYAGAAVLTIMVAIYLGSPYLAARNLKQAAVSGDADAVEAQIDFPAVRESLKSQLTAQLIKNMQNDTGSGSGLVAGLGAMFMPVIIGRAIDAYVTPAGIAAMVRGQKPTTPVADTNQDPTAHYSQEYVNLDRFRVKVQGSESDRVIGLLFERRGFASWKLIRVELPTEQGGAPS